MLAIVFAFLGLIFGALLAIFIQKKEEKFVKYAESLASGFMLAVVFFDLMPNASQKADFVTIFFGLLAGIVIILLISQFSAREMYTKLPNYDIIKKDIKSESLQNKSSPQLDDKKRLVKNLTTAFAVALHNIPEGIALGALDGQEILISTAILIALHNIPEGIAMSIPPAKIGIKWHKILLFAIITGACTVVGWGIGILVGGISEQFIAFMLAISSGAMLQIVFGDLIANNENKNCGNITLLGLLIGFVIATIV